MTRVGQFSASAVQTAAKFLSRDPLRKSITIQNHSASKDVVIKIGGAFKNAVVQTQTITFSSTPTAGAWKVTYNGNESGSLAYNINAADLQTALRLVSGLGSVTVAGSVAAGFVVTMTSVAHISGNPSGLTVTSNTLYKAAVHTISFSDTPSAGTWKIKVGAFTTAALDFDDDATAVQTAVQALTGLSSATVSGNYGSGFTLTLLGVSFPATVEVVDASTLEIEAVTEVQSIAFDNVPDAGTWTITYGEETTSALAFDANAAAVQAALRLFEGLEDVTVTGDYANDFVVTFVGVDGDVEALEVDDADLEFESGAVEASVSEDTAGVLQEDVTATVANTTAYAAVTGSVVVSQAGNLADVGTVIGEGASYTFSGDICQGDCYAKSEDSTAVSFEVIPG